MFVIRSLVVLFLLACLMCRASAQMPKPPTTTAPEDYTAAQREYADTKVNELSDLIKWFTERGGLSGPWATITRTKENQFRLQAREDIGPGDTIIQVDKAHALSDTPPVLSEHWVMYSSGLAELFDLIAGYPYDKTARYNALTLWFLHMESCLDRVNEDTGEPLCSTFSDKEWAPFFVYYRDIPLVKTWDLVEKKLLDKYGEGPTAKEAKQSLIEGRNSASTHYNDLFPRLANEFPDVYDMKYISFEKWTHYRSIVRSFGQVTEAKSGSMLVPLADLVSPRSPLLPSDIMVGGATYTGDKANPQVDKNVTYFMDARKPIRQGQLIRQSLSASSNMYSLISYGITFPEFTENHNIATPWGTLPWYKVPIALLKEIAMKLPADQRNDVEAAKRLVKWIDDTLATFSNSDADDIALQQKYSFDNSIHPLVRHIIQLRLDDKSLLHAAKEHCQAIIDKGVPDPREDL